MRGVQGVRTITITKGITMTDQQVKAQEKHLQDMMIGFLKETEAKPEDIMRVLPESARDTLSK